MHMPEALAEKGALKSNTSKSLVGASLIEAPASDMVGRILGLAPEAFSERVLRKGSAGGFGVGAGDKLKLAIFFSVTPIASSVRARGRQIKRQL